MINLTQVLKSGALAAVILGSTSIAALSADWRGWNIHPEGYPNTVALEEFAAAVEAATDGRVTAEVFNGGVLGSQPDAIE